MFTTDCLRQCAQGGLSLLVTVIIPATLTESALAQIRRLDGETRVFQPQNFVTEAADLQPFSLRERPPLLSSNPTPLSMPLAPQPPVINVETWQSEPVHFETEGATLEGTDDPGTAPLERGVPDFEAEDFEQPEPIDPAAAADTVPYELEEYIPEPEATPFVQFSAEVATPVDDFIEWRATLWGGIMTDNDLEESLTFQDIELEDSGIFGAGISRTLAGGNTIKIEGELQLLKHFGRQDHFEGIAALALRWELSPSFSVALIEGLSYATALPEIEDDNNTDESQFLNYLALEIEYLHTSQWGIAGRLHHRSGAYRQFGNAVGGSNAYLLGLRHRF